MKAGGTVLAVGDSTGLAEMLWLALDQSAYGNRRWQVSPPAQHTVLYSRLRGRSPCRHHQSPGLRRARKGGPVLRLKPGVQGHGQHRRKSLAAFDSDNPLMSGWALGQKQLRGAGAIVDTCVGKGRLVLMGPEVNQRAQSHAAFRFLFNGLDHGPASARDGSCR